MAAMICDPARCCGRHRVEPVVLDRGRGLGEEPLYRVTCYGYLVGDGYFSTVEQVRAALGHVFAHMRQEAA